ncbi:aminopeptidase [Formosa agariphila KMM 3901]|uniref:Aminopeptidase n=1 Tax=Formosa agariphila (strain DSM 15362 / KCTC 12365 / LMG 23005 / KMM 3901 / M-2Alg 35-1) TaxID=1347342 RepID=T2KNH3_FORAG|nr:M28 family metallopeptidase [Formosa agariphila]CDF79986.1 aminopeptidase [Formosa agariphila KMM 3901]
MNNKHYNKKQMPLHFILAFSSLFFVAACANTNSNTVEQHPNSLLDSTLVRKYANTITTTDLKQHLEIYASDDFEGRATGTPGQKKAANYIKAFYIKEQISSPIEDTIYYQHVPASYLPENIEDSENVLAYIKGSEKPEEIIVISAHLDHVGVIKGEIYNGADDDGSGTVAIMEIAQAFKQAALNGEGPKRSILFLHVTGEELGLYGSRYYSEHPVFPLKNTIANLNIDMIGRVDDKHKDNPDYIYLIGSDRLSDDLHEVSEKTNDTYFNLELDYTYNALDDKNRYYFRSDHYNFAKHNVPVIFYFNGTHADYHKATDTVDKINFPMLQKRAQLVFATAWQLANQEHRPALNDDVKLED